MRFTSCCFILGIIFLSSTFAWAQPDTLWSVRLDQNGVSNLYGGTSVPDGYIVVGYGTDATGDRDMLVARLSLTGQVLWTRMIGTSRNEEAWGVARTEDGNLFIAGMGVDASNTRWVYALAGLSADGDSLWWRNYSPTLSGQCKARDAVLLDDGNVAVVGHAVISGLNSNMWLLKCQPNGDTLWTRMYGGSSTDVGYRMCQRTDGGLAMVGSTTSIGGGGNDPWLVLTDASGNNPVQLTFGSSGEQNGNAVAVTESDDIFVGGRGSTNGGPPLIARCTAAGDTTWMYYYADAPNAQVRGLLPQLNGGVLSVGADMSSGSRAWLMAVGADGGINWTWTMNFSIAELNGVIPTNPRGGLAFGAANGYGLILRLGQPSFVEGIVREIATGAPVPNVYVTTLGSAFASLTDSAGHYSLVRAPGTYTMMTHGVCVPFDTLQTVETILDSIITVDLNIGVPDYDQPLTSFTITAQNHVVSESPLWLYNLGTGAMNFQVQAFAVSPATNWLQVNPEQGVIAAGESLAVSVIVDFDTTDVGAFDIYGRLEMHSNSCPDSTDELPVMVTVLKAGEPGEVPSDFALFPAYPNPFNPRTSIAFSVPRESVARLDIFNLAGQCVRTLVDGHMSPGLHRAEFGGSDLPSGLYVARLRGDHFTASQKLLLLK